MGFIMDGLEAEDYDRQYTDWALVKRIIGYFRPQAWKMLVVAAVVFLSSVMDLILPVVVSQALDQLQFTPETFDPVGASIILGLAASAGWVANMIRQWLSAEAVGDVTFDLREDAFNAVTERDMSFYDQFATGKVVSRVLSDTQAFSETVRLSINLMSRLLLVVLLIIYLFTVNVNMTLVLMTIMPFIIYTALRFRTVARRTVTNSRRQLATVNAHIQESISGIAVAKAFRREQMIYDEFKAVNHESYEVEKINGFVFGSIFPILVTIAGLGVAAVVWFGINLAQQGILTAGEWFLFIQGMGMIWFPLTSISSFWSQFQLGLAAGERVFALLDAEALVKQKADEQAPALQGEIEFVALDFQYTEGEPVLRDFSLHIQPGETLALVGHTGSGKSSIAKLINRFYEYQRGDLFIDRRDIRYFNLPSYRAQLGMVTQTPFLFDGSVMDNIRYGKPEATDEQVTRAANMVGRGDWLVSLQDGLQTQVGERGGSLSMGQRQLVAIARVLLQDPAIFILDEATASVDPLTETLIQEGLDTLLGARTSIVIAHRLSTIQHADRIIVLDHGAIIESGTHDQLMLDGGHYATLYDSYFRHQSLEYIERLAG
ncbi:MAG: ABC transporter ATP-binding protein [Chloroflexi bacterium]|nr:ABC transporter ATP-binding protein [Chloroflexota bacterium]MCY4247399.1 ABC transporter ATP-binding protein [Chloroflexota bacterium]